MSENSFDLIMDKFKTFSVEDRYNIMKAFLTSNTYRSFVSWFSIENSKNWVSFPGSGLIYIGGK